MPNACVSLQALLKGRGGGGGGRGGEGEEGEGRGGQKTHTPN